MLQDFHVINMIYHIEETKKRIFYIRRKMKTFTFIAMTLLSGAIAGVLLGLINQA